MPSTMVELPRSSRLVATEQHHLWRDNADAVTPWLAQLKLCFWHRLVLRRGLGMAPKLSTD